MTEILEQVEDVGKIQRYRYHKHSGKYRPLARSQMEIVRTVIDVIGFALLITVLLLK